MAERMYSTVLSVPVSTFVSSSNTFPHWPATTTSSRCLPSARPSTRSLRPAP